MHNILSKWLLIPALLAATAGCVHHPVAQTPQSSYAKQALNATPPITYLPELAGPLRLMSAAEIKSRGAALDTVYDADKSEENRVRLAAFLALAPPPAGDRNRAYILLNMQSNETQLGRLHPVAAVLLPLLQDVVSLKDAQAKGQQKLRDEQKRGDALQDKNTALQKKLDALSDLEKQMLERTPAKQKKL